MHNEGVAHEYSDINVRAIVAFAVGLVVVAVIVHVAMVVVFKLLESQAAANDPKVTPLAAAPVQMPPRTAGSPYFGDAPQPQLLTNEPLLLRDLRQTEASRLDHYGWVDENARVARVPIAEAKKLILERGLPARSGDADPGLGTVRPSRGESSGGRVLGTPGRQQDSATPPSQPGRTPAPAVKH
jgi:hypothetical protein